MEDTDQQDEVQFDYHLRAPLATGLLSLILLAGVAAQYSPDSGPAAIIAFLAFIFILFTSIAAVVAQVTLRLLGQPNFTVTRLFYTAILLASGGVFLVGLQTLRQLQVIDIVLVAVFEIVLLFYILRRF